MKGIYVYYIAAAITFNGCLSADSDSQEHRIETHVLLNIDKGFRFRDVEAKLGKGQHEFSARLDTNDYSCISYVFKKPALGLYFVFQRNELVAIIKQLPFEKELVPWERPKLVDPEQRMVAVLSQPHLTKENLSSLLMERARLDADRDVSVGMLPALLITSPVWLTHAPSFASSRIAYERLREKFNPDKIRLGMDADEVLPLFGPPARTMELEGGRQLQVFGVGNASNLPANVPHLWIGLVVEKNQVIRVFSHHFFRKNWVP